MKKSNFATATLFMMASSLFVSCGTASIDAKAARNQSKTSSIAMPMPDKLKALIGPNKINGYSFALESSNCQGSVVGTNIAPSVKNLDSTGLFLANERVQQGCDYTIIISLGKLDAAGVNLEKIYLTNNVDGQRTKVEAAKTFVPNIAVTALLMVTDDGKKDLGIDSQGVSVPSTGGPSGDPDVPAGDYDWRLEGKLSDVGTSAFTGNNYGSTYYQDVMSHTPEGDRDFQAGASTHAHETLHGMQSVMRNKSRDNDGFFYLEQGKGMYVIEPKENLKDVKNFIGASFRTLAKSRYDLYLVSQTQDWPNILYIFDEWNAYVATTRAAVEIKKAGKWDPSFNSDPIEGVVDFMYFCSASILAIKSIDPDYLKTNKQFKANFAMIMEESVKWYGEGKKEPLWSRSSAWNKMTNFQTSPDAAPIRAGVKELMGNAWTLRVLGF